MSSKEVKPSREDISRVYFCVMVVPDHGDLEITKYENHDEGRKALHDIHTLKFLGKFRGDVVAFIGEFVEVSKIAPVIQISDPVKGRLELRDEANFGETEV